jgi:hypothetical protein
MTDSIPRGAALASGPPDGQKRGSPYFQVPRSTCNEWHTGFVKALVALTVALALLLPSAARSDASTAKRTASLRLAAAQPVSLGGSRFLDGERVTVVASSQGRMRSRTVTAGDAGTFLVRFTGMPFDRCHGFLAVARGARGSFAVYKLPDLMCPPRG